MSVIIFQTLNAPLKKSNKSDFVFNCHERKLVPNRKQVESKTIQRSCSFQWSLFYWSVLRMLVFLTGDLLAVFLL